MLNKYIYNYFLKYVCFLFGYSYIIFTDYIHININNKIYIDIDNEFNVSLYEEDILFNNYKTNLKPIAFYHPEYNNISFLKYFNCPFNKNKNAIHNMHKLVKSQVKLARRHQIYGFAIYYDPFHIKNIILLSTNAFLNYVNFPFFIVWKNDRVESKDINIIDFLISNISKFMQSENYIKINNRPILSISCPSYLINETNLVPLLRKKAKKIIGKIFLLYPFRGKLSGVNFIRGFDAIYDFSKIDLFDEITNRPNIIHYSGFIYKNLILNKINYNFTLFRTSYLNYNNYKDYKPEKFYLQNKIIIKSANLKYSNNNGIIFVDSWNDYYNGNYLEFDEKFGYSTINSFSKSILNLPYQSNNFSDNAEITIAVQVHVFYEEIFKNIINKINQIPFKYDIYISTTSEEKKLIIEKYLIDSHHNNYEIKIMENKGRDVYPFINQMKYYFKYYKYICHLHTKKSEHKKNLGSNWSNYLYKNLIGSKETISDIIFDFEKNKKLGFIFPEEYYEIKKGIKDFENSNLSLNSDNKEYMNFILDAIFHKYKVGEKLVFPVGNMFWAKTKAIYQIFKLKLKFPDELGQINTTIMHAIERIWLYLVKINGYYYKKIIKYY